MTQPLRFDGDVFAITGAGRGLGRAYALALAARGASVVVNDPGPAVDGSGSDASAADAVVAEIRALGGSAEPSYDSVATLEGGAAVVEAALRGFGRIDGAIHNAGILRDATLARTPLADVDAVLSVHLRAAFFVGQPAFRAMKERGYGRFVMTTSAAGLFGNFGQTAYGSAKAGLVGFTRSLALEGARYGIAANAIAPMARTRLAGDVFGDAGDALDPEYVVPMVLYLCSRACSVSGEVFSAGGGRFARVFTGVTRGWRTDRIPAPEDIVARMPQILDESDHLVPREAREELSYVIEAPED